MYHKEILWLEEFVKQVDDGIYVNQANPGRAYKALAAAYSVVSLSTSLPCADPEVGDRGSDPGIPRHHRPTSETPLKWQFAGGPMVAHLEYSYGPPLPFVNYDDLRKKNNS